MEDPDIWPHRVCMTVKKLHPIKRKKASMSLIGAKQNYLLCHDIQNAIFMS